MTPRPVSPPPWERPPPAAGGAERRRGVTVGRVLALTAAILVVLGSVAALTVVLYRPRGHPVDFAHLEPGQCFNRKTLGLDFVSVRVVSCESAHRHEAFAVIRYPAPDGVAFPGKDAIQEVAWSSCTKPLETYLSGAALPAGLRFGFVYPVEQRWEQGERTIVCEVFNADGTSRNRSIRSA